MRAKNRILGPHARMWPRDVFYRNNLGGKGPKKGNTARWLFRTIELLKKPGVYVLYRDDVPYYVGQATKLRTRLWRHACNPDGRYFNHWNFFSAFVVEEPEHRNDIETLLSGETFVVNVQVA